MSWIDVLKVLVLVGVVMLMSFGFMLAVRKMDGKGW